MTRYITEKQVDAVHELLAAAEAMFHAPEYEGAEEEAKRELWKAVQKAKKDLESL